MCFKTCTLSDAKSCRGQAKDKGGDYECYAWDNLQIHGGPVASKPICMSAASNSCTSLGTGLQCSALGIKGTNSTNMQCRDRTTGKVLAAHTASGVCLDNTASGTF